jgi:hypothetical protein
MRVFASLLVMTVTTLASVAIAQIGRDSQPTTKLDVPSGAAQTVDQVIDHVIAREHEELALINAYRPIVETYVQVFNPKRDDIPSFSRDDYYLGVANLSNAKRISYQSMLAPKDQLPKKGFVDEDFNPLGFVQMVYIDRNGFDRQHYSFRYVGREFLGEVRCVMFDVSPLPNAGPGRFIGRIWAEDKDYTVVRFNGDYLGVKKGYSSHFDSWRLNVQPGLWLPSYAFAEETELRVRAVDFKFLNNRLRFKAQTRFWGYNLKEPNREQEFSDLVVDAKTPVMDAAANEQRDQSPIQAERQWRRQAEDNVLDALQRAGLLAPAGQVDKVLDTVASNLEVTNNLNIEPRIRCRVLTTATFDLFAVGHVIVVSRGLLDVLPDEATLATMLAQEFGDIIVSRAPADRYAFYDIVQLPTLDALRRFSFRVDAREREASHQKAIALLRNSPYKDKLSSAGLFLKQFSQDSGSLRALVSPHMGDRIYVASQLTSTAPALQANNVEQIAALPLGSRIKLDPWTDAVELINAKATPVVSAREKMPLEITPFAPYLTRYSMSKTSDESPKVALDESGHRSLPHTQK